MFKKVVLLLSVFLCFLSPALFAHETEIALPKSVSNFGSHLSTNKLENSLLVWNRTIGANVYSLVNGEWQLQNYTLKPDSDITSWRFKQQTLDTNGDYAAITSIPENKVYVYKWDGNEWDMKNIATCPATVKSLAVSSNGEVAIQSEENDRIYVFSSVSDKIFRSYGGGPLSDPKTLNGPIEIDSNIMVVSSSEESEYNKSTIFENWAPTATISEARAIGIDGTRKNIIISTSDGKTLELYKYDYNLNENGGWYKADSINASDIGATEFGYSIDSNGIDVYVAGIADFDGEYGKLPGHGVIYNFIVSGTNLIHKKQFLSKDFSNNGQELTVLATSSQLIIGDKDANKTNISSTVGGEIYSFSRYDKNSINLILETLPPQQIHEIGDTIFFQFNIKNDSNTDATEVLLDIDYNPRLGLLDSKNNPDFHFVSAISENGSCNEHESIKNRLTCSLNDLAPYEEANITLEMNIENVGELNIFANTYALELDGNYLDNFNLTSVNVSTANAAQYVTPLEFDSYVNDIEDYSYYKPQLSMNGDYVTFYTNAPLTENTDESYPNIYTVDRYNNIIELISLPSEGFSNLETANGGSTLPKITDDGELVVFISHASNLVANDTNNVNDIFAHNRITKETYRVSVSNTGEESNALSSGADISANGRFIVFHSLADNLVENDDNNYNDIFIHDTLTRTISSIESKESDVGELANILSPSISGDGRYIAFVANTTSEKTYYIFLYDQVTQQIKKISLTELSDGQTLTNASAPEISDNAKFIYYVLNQNIYRFNVETDETELVTQGIDSNIGNGSSLSPSVSANGRFALYSSSSSNLVENDTNDLYDIFVYDAETKETAMVNFGVGGYQAKGNSYHCAISPDGTTISFSSIAHNLTFYDDNDVYDIFFVENPFIANLAKPVNLQITNTTANYQTEIDEEFETTFYFSNITPDTEATATNIIVSAQIPEGISIVSATSSIGECSVEDQTINCLVEMLEPSSMTETLTITAVADISGEYSISARIIANEEEIDVTNNNTQISIEAIEKVDLYLSNISLSEQLYVGDEIDLSYIIGNSSETPAQNITVEIKLPEELTASSIEINNGTCQITSSNITCIIDEIAPLNITSLNVKATATSHGVFEISAQVFSEQNDSNYINNQSVTQLELLPKSDLMVSISTTTNTIFKNEQITYLIEVTNTGLSTATESKLTTTIAEELTIDAIQTTHGSCDYTNNLISCDLGDLASNETANITVSTSQNNQEESYSLKNLAQKHLQLKDKIATIFKQDDKYTKASIKEGFNHLYKKHKDALANWKNDQQTFSGSFTSTVTVASITPETNLDNNRASITTEISQKSYLKIIKNGRGKGSIKANGINCENKCNLAVAKDSQITITAITEPGSKFKHWSGACKGTKPVCTIDMNKKHETVIGIFK